jgi:glyoxylase-like metal-dependent hydrolase (beta-lactamase superfamily II)
MSRRLIPVEGNSQRLDGGAMFGNCPRAMWEQWIRPDDQHRIPLACRSLLVLDGERRILLEAGIGSFFQPKLRERFGVQENRHVLLDNLARTGLTDSDIDVVVLSHLHFDHAGGLLAPWREDEAPRLLFPRAQFLVSWTAWERALEPHPRDRASFIPALPGLLKKTGRLVLVTRGHSEVLGGGYQFRRSDGHTPGMLLTEIETADGPVVFAADLIPGRAWVHEPITMGYDRFPELLVHEKRALLDDMVSRGGRLFFTHDPEVALARVVQDENGRFLAVV